MYYTDKVELFDTVQCVFLFLSQNDQHNSLTY